MATGAVPFSSAMAHSISQPPPGVPAPRRLRDLLVIELGATCLVMACDSAGGIGPGPADVLRVPGRTVGLFAARVALMEVIASGARPLGASLTVSGPPSVAAEVRRGVLEEMRLAGLDETALIMSTEKNMPTFQTGVGVTAVGTAAAGGLLAGGAKPGHVLAAVGLPKVGPEVWEGDPETVDLPTTLRILRSGAVGDLLPVGSRGIRAESLDLAASAGLKLRLHPDQLPDRCLARHVHLDLDKSAGPATVLLLTAPPSGMSVVELAASGRPVHVLGVLE